MALQKVLPFPIRYPELFSPDINREVLSSGEFQRLLSAAIRALPHVHNRECGEELKLALCEVLSLDTVA